MHLPNRAYTTGVNGQDLENSPSSPHIFSDVVLIDKSHGSLLPQLYQVKTDLVEEQNQSFNQAKQAGFVMIGEVIKIDKKKKQIHLTDNKTVSYKYLILASGMSQSSLSSIHDKECAAGVYALVDALKIRKNLPEHFFVPEIRKSSSSEPFTMKPLEEGLSISKMIKLKLKNSTVCWSSPAQPHRVYEVQL